MLHELTPLGRALLAGATPPTVPAGSCAVSVNVSGQTSMCTADLQTRDR